MTNEILCHPLKGYSLQDIANRIASFPTAVWLDSSDTQSKWSRFSILTHSPTEVFVYDRGGDPILLSNYFEALSQSLLRYQTQLSKPTLNLPFFGGFLGFVGYSATPILEKWGKPQILKSKLPDAWFGYFPHAIVFDHHTQQMWYVQQPTGFPLDLFLDNPTVSFEKPVVSAFESETTQQDYEKNVEAIRKMIRKGDLYQVNLSRRLKAKCSGDMFPLYESLRAVSPSPFSGYLQTSEWQILSSSPERFFSVRDGLIQTHPIKGTRPRGLSFDEDQTQLNDLVTSEKDKAELMMIVDLLRNDIGMVCEAGSVHVQSLRHIESFAQVHQAVSVIQGRLNPELDVFQVLQTVLPGGSITGAPKSRAVHAISSLESVSRSVYTGAIGGVCVTGQADFNIAIRTLYRVGTDLFTHAGGGIVSDSDPTSEWLETEAKLQGVLSACR